MARLTVKQEAFCVAYSKHGNASRAFREAGYIAKNDETARASASRLLTYANVIARLGELREQSSRPSIMDAEERRETLSEIARDADAAKNERIKAIDVLNKMDAIYIKRQEITGAAPVVIVDNVRE